MSNLEKQFQAYHDSVEKVVPQYSALLGKTRTVIEHPTRNGFCYARMADNLNELITVFNDKVSRVYNLPVIIERRGNNWYVVGRDIQRYNDWGTNSAFVTNHHEQHEFNRDDGTGGDTVFVYPDQFMPLLVYPSGTSGASNLMIAPYMLQRANDFAYVGNTGTGNLLIYKPTNNQAIMGLVYLDKTTGNPGFLVASGTPFSAGVTGSAGIVPYLPYPSSNQEPLYFVRLVSGTSSIDWSNLYNARQFIGGSSSTGTSGGGGYATGTMMPFGFVSGSIPFSNGAGYLTEDNPNLRFDLRGMRLGNNGSGFNFADIYPLIATAHNVNESNTIGIHVYGTGTSGNPNATFGGWHTRGTPTTPLPTQKGDNLLTLSGFGFDGSVANWALSGGRIVLVADNNWVTGSNRSTRMDFEVTPSGSATRKVGATVYGDSLNIPTGSTYNIGGVPAFTGINTGDQNVGMALIQTITLVTGTTSFDFTSIPSTYTNLRLIFSLRSAAGTGADEILVVVNNDTATNYESTIFYYYTPAAYGTQAYAGATAAHVAYTTANGALANSFGGGEITIFDYANTNKSKYIQARAGIIQSVAIRPEIYDGSSLWNSTSAINRLTIKTLSTAVWMTYSKISLYGMK